MTIRSLPRRLKFIFVGMVLSFLLDSLFVDDIVVAIPFTLHIGIAPFPFFHAYWAEGDNAYPWIFVAERVFLLIPLVGISLYNEHPKLYKWLTYLPYSIAVATTVVWVITSRILNPIFIPWMLIKDALFLVVLMCPKVNAKKMCWLAILVAGISYNVFFIKGRLEDTNGSGIVKISNGYSLAESTRCYTDESSESHVYTAVSLQGPQGEVVREYITDYCYNDHYVCVKWTVLEPWFDVPEECKYYIIIDSQQSIKYDACDTAEEFEALCEELGITDLCEWIACS